MPPGLESATANLLYGALFAASFVQLGTGELSDRVETLPVIVVPPESWRQFTARDESRLLAVGAPNVKDDVGLESRSATRPEFFREAVRRRDTFLVRALRRHPGSAGERGSRAGFPDLELFLPSRFWTSAVG